MAHLTVFFDGACGFCTSAARWLGQQAQRVPLQLVDARTARDSLGGLGGGRELVVVNAHGYAWVGPEAFVMCFWALRDTHGLAWLLAEPFFWPVTQAFFEAVSAHRGTIAELFGPPCPDGACRAEFGPYRGRAARG